MPDRLSTFEMTTLGRRTATRNVALRSADRQDLDYLYSLATRDDISYRWRFRGAIPPFEAFVATFHDNVLMQAVALDPRTGEGIGHLLIYNADLRNGTAYLGVIVDPRVVGQGVGNEACILFMQSVLDRWPLRKVYVEIPEYTFGALAGHMGDALGRDVVREGCLIEYTYFAGRYWDVHLCSIGAESWRRWAQERLDNPDD